MGTGEEVKTVVEDECVHHWLIEEPKGKISNGVCKRCGESRKFRNGLEALDFIYPTEGRFGSY